jgi:parvulin-like peptidyl-prolyl isomerase
VARRHRYARVEKEFGKELLDAIAAANEGDLIGPIRTPDGSYEVARKMDEVKPIPRPLEEVRDSIRSRLEREERDRAYKALLNSLREAAADKTVKSARLLEAEKAGGEGVQGSNRPPAGAGPVPAKPKSR